MRFLSQELETELTAWLKHDRQNRTHPNRPDHLDNLWPSVRDMLEASMEAHIALSRAAMLLKMIEPSMAKPADLSDARWVELQQGIKDHVVTCHRVMAKMEAQESMRGQKFAKSATEVKP